MSGLYSTKAAYTHSVAITALAVLFHIHLQMDPIFMDLDSVPCADESLHRRFHRTQLVCQGLQTWSKFALKWAPIVLKIRVGVVTSGNLASIRVEKSSQPGRRLEG